MALGVPAGLSVPLMFGTIAGAGIPQVSGSGTWATADKLAGDAAAKNLPRVPLDDDVARKGQHTIHPKGLTCSPLA
jgi:hypothetical protein